MLNPLILEERNNTAKNWGAFLRNIYAYADGVIDGCEVTVTSNSITIAKGHFISCGVVIEVDGATTTAVTPTTQNGYVRLKCKIDTSQPPSETEASQTSLTYDFSATTTFPALIQEDINDDGNIYETEMAVCKLTDGNITQVTRSLVDRVIDANTLGGKTEDQLSVANAVTAQNALKLNGQSSTYYGIATNEFKFMGALAGTVNLDTISTAGAQRWQLAGITNPPSGLGGHGMLFSFMANGYATQRIVDTSGNETTRFFQGTQWTLWQNVMKYMKMLSGNDTLTNCNTNGMYMLANVTNSGIVGFGNYGMLRVEAYRPNSGNPYIKQVVCDTSNQKWERIFNGSSWTAWKQTMTI